MIEVENKYDFTVEELTDILEQTPIRVDLDTNEAVAKYIIQALNVNRIIKESKNPRAEAFRKKENPEPDKTAFEPETPYSLVVKRRDGSVAFRCPAYTLAFYVYDPIAGRAKKGLISQEKPTARDIANISELLGNVNGWGTMQ